MSERPLPSALGRPLVIAHRGASADRPQNTFAAYRLALELRADMIEIDLHVTRDSEIAIAHDAELEELGAPGEIADRSLEELRELDAGEGERVPELIEVLHTFGAAIPFNLEIKQRAEGLYEGIEARALEAVRRFDLLEQTLFSSFYDPVLAELRRLEPDARLAVLVSYKESERTFERAEAVGAEAINPWFGLVDRALVAEAHSRGLAVFPYTVDEVQRMQHLIELGVDGLFTNHPGRMRSVLAQPEPRRS